jgi:aminoglycoside phosphotransferase (APT) family kinase protein
LVHTDLGGANLLLTAHGDAQTVTGVLDWDGAQIGNQASDLASIAATSGWRLAGQIDTGRARPEGPMIGIARVIETTFALQQALAGRAQRGQREPCRWPGRLPMMLGYRLAGPQAGGEYWQL